MKLFNSYIGCCVININIQVIDFPKVGLEVVGILANRMDSAIAAQAATMKEEAIQ